MEVLEVFVLVAVYGANEDIFDVVDAGLVVHVLLKVLLAIGIVRELYHSAARSDTAHSKRARYRDLFHLA